MADIIELLRTNYDADHGVVNVRPLVDNLLESSNAPFEDAAGAFKEAESQWRPAILEAMRTLAAMGRCTQQGAMDLLDATGVVAGELGFDEYFKTVNALVHSQQARRALVAFLSAMLERSLGDSFQRRLAFYILGMLLQHDMPQISGRLREALDGAAKSEESNQLRNQFQELLARV